MLLLLGLGEPPRKIGRVEVPPFHEPYRLPRHQGGFVGGVDCDRERRKLIPDLWAPIESLGFLRIPFGFRCTVEGNHCAYSIFRFPYIYFRSITVM
jgi:hypothetical protein